MAGLSSRIGPREDPPLALAVAPSRPAPNEPPVVLRTPGSTRQTRAPACTPPRCLTSPRGPAAAPRSPPAPAAPVGRAAHGPAPGHRRRPAAGSSPARVSVPGSPCSRAPCWERHTGKDTGWEGARGEAPGGVARPAKPGGASATAPSGRATAHGPPRSRAPHTLMHAPSRPLARDTCAPVLTHVRTYPRYSHTHVDPCTRILSHVPACTRTLSTPTRQVHTIAHTLTRDTLLYIRVHALVLTHFCTVLTRLLALTHAHTSVHTHAPRVHILTHLTHSHTHTLPHAFSTLSTCVYVHFQHTCTRGHAHTINMHTRVLSHRHTRVHAHTCTHSHALTHHHVRTSSAPGASASGLCR